MFSVIFFKAQSPFCFTSSPINSASIWYPEGVNGDFNSDGKLDFFCVIGNYNVVHGLLSNTTNTMTQVSYTFNNQFSFSRCIAADSDNDGKLDLVINDPFTNSIFCILYGDGVGGFYNVATVVPPNSPTIFDVGDLNNDGKPEIISCNINLSVPSLNVMSSIGVNLYAASIQIPLTYTPITMLTKDFNNDGKKDVLITNGSTITIYKGLSTSSFGGAYTFTVPTAAYSGLDVSDYNNDGKLDISVLNNSNISIYNGNGNFTFTLTSTFSVNPAYSIFKSGDFDNDGKNDLIVTSSGASSNLSASIYRNFGASTFSLSHISTYTTVSSWEYVIGISTANFNGDNKLDFILSFQNSSKGVEIFLNCNSIGLNENTNDLQLVSLYPNPASEIVNIELYTNEANSDYKKVSVYNQLGQAIKVEELFFEAGKTKINTSDLSNGAYYVSISDESGLSVKRPLVVSR